MPSPAAFFDPEPRLALMKDMGIDRTLLWPTLASVLEERLADDPDLVVVIVHALNEWMHEHWTYVYSDAIFSTPIISLAAGSGAGTRGAAVHPRARRQDLPDPRGAGADLEGAQVVRAAGVRPVLGRGRASRHRRGHALRATRATPRYVNEWEGIGTEMLPFQATGSPAFQAMMSEKDVVQDAVASIIGHGLATRFPKLKFMPVEYWAGWIRPFVAAHPGGLRPFAGALRRGPVRGVQAERLRAHLPRARPAGPARPRASRPIG